MPPSGEMVGQQRKNLDALAKAQDDSEGAGDDDSLEKFLDEWDIPHGGDVAGGIYKTDNPRSHPGRGSEGQRTVSHTHKFPPPSNTFPSPVRPPDRTGYSFNSHITPSTLTEPIYSKPLSFVQPSSDTRVSTQTIDTTTIYITDSYGSTISTKPLTSSHLLAGVPAATTTSISFKTIVADNPGTVTDTATIVISGGATKVLFPQHDKSDRPPTGPPRGPPKSRMKNILLGVFLGVGVVILFVACWFGYRAHKRRKARETVIGNRGDDSGSIQESAAPEMQATEARINMPSIAVSPASPSPFPNQLGAGVMSPLSSDGQGSELVNAGPLEPPIIINPFSDPTYNSSSGIEDYVVSNGVPLGREPENPFLHPDDGRLAILGRTRPNSAGDFPPEYTTVDGNPIDPSGRRVREDRFPFGDEALSLRTESETSSVHQGPAREPIPEYQYDDPNGVADGFQYNPAVIERLAR